MEKLEVGKKITVDASVPMVNPEDWFNDMIEDGVSVEEALDTIIVDSIVMNKVNEMVEEQDPDDEMEMFGSHEGVTGLGGGMVEVTIESLKDHRQT